MIIYKSGDTMNFDILSKKNRTDFIKVNQKFIINSISEITHANSKRIKEDELNIAMFAFNYACNSYINEDENGNFYNYAKMLIRNNILSYFSKLEIVPSISFSNNILRSPLTLTEIEKAAEEKIYQKELSILNDLLNYYNLNYIILSKSCPLTKKAKEKALNIAFLCSTQTFLLNLIYEKKYIPLKEISIFTRYDIKFIRRWQNYILMLIIILSNENLPYTRSYLNICVGGTRWKLEVLY